MVYAPALDLTTLFEVILQCFRRKDLTALHHQLQGSSVVKSGEVLFRHETVLFFIQKIDIFRLYLDDKN